MFNPWRRCAMTLACQKLDFLELAIAIRYPHSQLRPLDDVLMINGTLNVRKLYVVTVIRSRNPVIFRLHKSFQSERRHREPASSARQPKKTKMTNCHPKIGLSYLRYCRSPNERNAIKRSHKTGNNYYFKKLRFCIENDKYINSTWLRSS